MIAAERPVAGAGRRPIAVDLFSGTGGATRALADAGWVVITIDLDRRCGARVVADVRQLPIAAGDVGRPTIDLLWASSPCTEFSDANPNRPARPSLDLVFAALTAVRDLKPRYWIIENVRGAIPYLGIPVQKIGPWCLWGYFPPIPVTYDMQLHRKSRYRSAVARAAIPLAFSQALREAIELHLPLKSLLDLRPWRRHRHVAARDGRRSGGQGDLLA